MQSSGPSAPVHTPLSAPTWRAGAPQPEPGPERPCPHRAPPALRALGVFPDVRVPCPPPQHHPSSCRAVSPTYTPTEFGPLTSPCPPNLGSRF